MTPASKSKNTNRRTSDQTAEASEPAEEDQIPGRKLTRAQEAQLMEKTGFSRGQLYNRRGWHSEKGLAAMMDSDDNVVEVHETHVVIQTSSGAVQTLYNLEKETPFLKRLKSVEPN